MNFKLPIKSNSGNVTLAHIDGPNDVWVIAIVEDYNGSQDYGNIIAEFGTKDDFDLSEEQVKKLLEAFDPKPLNTKLAGLKVEISHARSEAIKQLEFCQRQLSDAITRLRSVERTYSGCGVLQGNGVQADIAIAKVATLESLVHYFKEDE